MSRSAASSSSPSVSHCDCSYSSLPGSDLFGYARHALLVERAAGAAKAAGCAWLHVDFDPELEGFYAGCGFLPTAAGLLRLAP